MCRSVLLGSSTDLSSTQLLLSLQQHIELRFDPGLALGVSKGSALSVGLHQLYQQSPLGRVGGKQREGRG